MRSSSKITAIIPVRSGSKRVPNKSVRPFGDTTLLDLKIESLKEAEVFDEIILSTDSDDILKFAERHGISSHKREEYYASDYCSASDFFCNLTTIVSEGAIAYCPPTSPFINKETLEKAKRAFQVGHGIDSVATVSTMKHHMWLGGKPLNYDPSNSPNSQELPNIYKITYGVCICPRDLIMENKNIVGKKPALLILDEIEAMDIDTALDFKFAEYIYESEFKNVQ